MYFYIKFILVMYLLNFSHIPNYGCLYSNFKTSLFSIVNSLTISLKRAFVIYVDLATPCYLD